METWTAPWVNCVLSELKLLQIVRHLLSKQKSKNKQRKNHLQLSTCVSAADCTRGSFKTNFHVEYDVYQNINNKNVLI